MTKITSRPQEQEPDAPPAKWTDEKEVLALLMTVATDPALPMEGAFIQVRGALLALEIMGIVERFDVVPISGPDFDVTFQLSGKPGAVRGVFIFAPLGAAAQPAKGP